MKRIIIYLFLFISLACSRNSNQPNNFGENTTVAEENSSQRTKDSLKAGSPNKSTPKNVLIEDSPDSISNTKAEFSISFVTLEWDAWRTLIITLVSFSLILLIASISMFRRNTSLNKEVNTKNKKLNNKNASIRDLELEVKTLNSRIKSRNNRIGSTNQENHKKPNKVATSSSKEHLVQEDPGPYEKQWSISRGDKSSKGDPSYLSSSKAPQKIFYADKATENKTFSSVSEQRNEHRSVFKLILEKANSEKAEFEIVDSDFILKMAANSPDTYLYPVCKPENSNQNFSGEIVTTKRGVARKVDGKWIVNEEDKATIKFQ